VDAREPVVVSVGMVHGGQAFNIIPETVSLEGTIRSYNPDVRREVHKHFRLIVTETAAAHGAKAAIELDDGSPPLRNDPELGKRMKPSLERAAGDGNVIETELRMGAEDFASYAEKVPSFFIFLGVRNESIGAVEPVHSPRTVIDEAALPLGVRSHVQVAMDYLRGTGDTPGPAARGK
jgi:amidohydrolase